MIIQFPEIEAAARQWHEQKLKIVLTNGCFDLLHVGHLHTFTEAKNLGDLLVVGVNSDHSVQSLKGPTRPIISQTERCQMLDALKPIDYVTVFHESTACSLLERIQPHIYVKGGDYDLHHLPEKNILEQLKTRVVFIPFLPGHSTSKLITKIKQTNF